MEPSPQMWSKEKGSNPFDVDTPKAPLPFRSERRGKITWKCFDVRMAIIILIQIQKENENGKGKTGIKKTIQNIKDRVLTDMRG